MSTNAAITVDPNAVVSPPAYPPGMGSLGITATSQANRPTVNLIVVSDFNCPWCYVAHKEIQIALARARASHPNTLFTVEYRPFELDPTLPGAREKPMCKIACYKAKFGEEKMKKVSAVLKERGRQVGIDFHLAGKTRQTTNAHRLALKAWLCGGEAAQTKMVDALFAAFFERETDIGCYDFLSHAAESTGLMTAQQARDFLMSDKLKDEVQCLIRHSVLREIKGVPFTIVANQWAIQGAETSDNFFRAFDFAANTAETATTPFVHAAQGVTPSAHAMSAPNGISGTAPACKSKVAPSIADDVSEAATIASVSGTSGPTTPTTSTFGTESIEGRKAVFV